MILVGAAGDDRRDDYLSIQQVMNMAINRR